MYVTLVRTRKNTANAFPSIYFFLQKRFKLSPQWVAWRHFAHHFLNSSVLADNECLRVFHNDDCKYGIHFILYTQDVSKPEVKGQFSKLRNTPKSDIRMYLDAKSSIKNYIVTSHSTIGVTLRVRSLTLLLKPQVWIVYQIKAASPKCNGLVATLDTQVMQVLQSQEEDL